ncbi:MAG: glycine oxidase ThiO [Planctomycetota bacterium]
MARSQPDILIIGGGVIGLTTALELAQNGLRVLVTDRQTAGREASWAGAGMLPPGGVPNSPSPEARLRSFSHSLWPALTARLHEITGHDNGYRVCGSLLLTEGEQQAQKLAGEWAADNVTARQIGAQDLKDSWPALACHHTAGVWLPEQAQVRNPWHLQALRAACEQLKVEVLEQAGPVMLHPRQEHVEAVTIGTERLSPHKVCVAAGAWTASILQPLGISLPIHPIRGQMIQLRSPRPLFSCMLESGRRYLVPRTDGLILAGSTEEHAGFEKASTAAGVAGLIEFACELVPELRHQELVRCWSGLRPGSADDLPLLGNVPGYCNLFVAAGHFRAGLQMSPGTARIMSAVLRQECSPVSLTGLDVERFQTAPPAGNEA